MILLIDQENYAYVQLSNAEKSKITDTSYMIGDELDNAIGFEFFISMVLAFIFVGIF